MSSVLLEEIEFTSTNASLLHDAARNMAVAELREVYSDSYLLQIGLCTRKEIAASYVSTSIVDKNKDVQKVARVMDQVVGAEDTREYSFGC